MQISNKAFRHNFVEIGGSSLNREKGARPLFRRLLFWNITGKAPISLVNRNKGNGARPLFSPNFPPVLLCAYHLLDLTKTRG